MTTINTQSARTQSTTQRMQWRVLPLVMGAFLMIGLLGMFGVRTNAYDSLATRHNVALAGLSHQLTAVLEQVAEDVTQVAQADDLRQFGLASATNRSINTGRNDALAIFLRTLQQRPDLYTAIRYIDDDTFLRTEAVATISGTHIIAPEADISFAGDEGFEAALTADIGTLYLGSMFLQNAIYGEQLVEPHPILRISAPVYFRGTSTEPQGVLQVDVSARAVLDTINNAAVSSVFGYEGRQYVLENSQGQALADTQATLEALFTPLSVTASADTPARLRISRPGELSGFLTANEGHLQVADLSGSIVSALPFELPLEGADTPWRLVVVDSATVIFAENYSQSVAILVISLAVGVVVTLLLNSVLGRMFAPYEYASRIAQEAVTSTEAVKAPALAGAGGDLIEAITQISSRVEDLNKLLSNQRHRLTRNIEIAARVSRETAMLSDIDKLLNRVIDLICDEYSFYHAQVYLVDEVRQNAVLVFSHGEPGRQLLAQDHRIPIGSPSVIGATTAQARPIIVNDTRQQTTRHAFNPVLPHTRAEMALPLKIGDEVLGALDIQSASPNAFQDEELQAFSLLADQVAIAVYNGRLLLQSRQRIEQIDRLNRQLTRSTWEDAASRLGLARVYRYDLREVTPVDPDATDEPTEATSEAVSMPIRIRGEVVGAMDVTVAEGDSLSEGDHAVLQAVTERVALALENARLFQETQLSLSETSTLYDLSRSIHESENLQGVIEAIIRTVMPDAIGGQVLEFADHAYGAAAQWLTITADWSVESRDWQQATLMGLRLFIPDYQFLTNLAEHEVTFVSDLEADERVDAALKVILRSLHAEAFVLIPLNMRGLWRASLLVEFAQPRRFSDRDRRIYNALIEQAGAAVDNRLLLQQTEATLELQERLYAASRSINTAETFVDMVAALLATASGPDLNFALSLLEGRNDDLGWPSTERIVARTHHGQVHEADEVHRLYLSPESPLYAREPQEIRDEDPTEPAESPFIERMRAQGSRYNAIFPLFSDNQPVALMHVTYPDLYEMEPEDYEFYVAITGQLSTVLQKRRLLEQTERALEETRLLYEASRAITAAPDLTEVYQVSTDYLANGNTLLSRAAVLLTNPEGDPDALFLEYAYAWTRASGTANTGLQVPSDSVPYVKLVREAGGVVSYRSVSRELAESAHLEMLESAGVASMVIAPLQFRQQWFGVLVCESFEAAAFDTRFSRFVQAIADQVAITIENRRLFVTAETERSLLSSILETMPSGVLVLDAQTFIPIQVNDQVAQLLGRAVDMEAPFTAALYHLHRTGTDLPYADEDLPIRRALSEDEGGRSPADDIVVYRGEGHIDLLMNAAPIRDTVGNITSIVAVLEDISSLRLLESALQDNLRETITMYEMSRALAAAEEIEDVLDILIAQLATIESDEAAVLLLDEDTGQWQIARTLYAPPSEFLLPAALLEGSENLFVSDTASLDDTLRQELESTGVRALAALPLQARIRNQPTAWVIALYTEPYDFTDERRRFFNTLADSGATVLDNRYLFVSTQLALQEASILYQASRALTNVNEHQDILNAVTDYLINENTKQVFMVLLATSTWDHPNASADVVASWSADESYIDLGGVTLSPDQFPAWRQLSASKLVAIDDIYSTDELDPMEQAGIDSLGVRSLVIMPLRVGNRVIGSIWLGGPDSQRFTERDMRIYQAFAEQTSITLEAARLLEQTERRAHQLATSAEVSQIASSILDLNELLPRIVNLIRSAFTYDHVQVFLMDREDEYAVLQASTGEAGEQLLNIRHKLAKGSASVIGQVTALAEPVVALDTGMADVIHKPNPYLPHTRSEMALPLIIKGVVVGALDVQSNQPNAFTDEDVQVLTVLAAQISVAIDNARLFEQAERRASDMSLLFTITTAAASAESLAESLQNVTEDLIDSLNARTVGLYLPVEYIDELTEETFVMLQLAAASGIDQPLTDTPEIKVGDPDNLIGSAAANFRSVIVNKVEEEPLYTPLAADARSAVVVPLTSAAQLIGLIVLESEDALTYNHESLTLLQTMGGSLSAIIQNAQLLEKVQQTNDQLRELDRVKSEFLASMSHELRTPLNSIIGFSRVILKGIDGPLTEMQEQDLSTIYNSGQHLLGLINDILDQAKIAAGKMDLKPDYFDIKPVVEGVRSIGIGLVKDKPINIRINIESGLPKVYGDEFRTRQVLINLISNATKFTQKGVITLSVYRHYDDEQAREMVRIDVNDTGIGIAEEDMPLLFEAFRQVDSSLTRTAGGTGLGLPISKSLVEMQGGVMAVSSKVNVGSTFSITLPLHPLGGPVQDKKDTGSLETVEVEVMEDQAEVPLGDGPEDTMRLHADDLQQAIENGNTDKRSTGSMPVITKRQILLIEDNPDRVDQYRRLLQREGFDIFTASIPLEAEAMASGLRPMMIIMDVNFANGAGWDILRKLKDRDDTFDIPVIVVTLDGESERAYQLGAHTFLQLPFVPEELLEAIHEAERESRTERILIIDDQPDSTRLLTQLLDTYTQYRVFAAHNGAEGVSMVARRRPDLVILDLRMPEMDGFAVLEELRSNPETANIPVLVVTGDTLNASERDLLVDVGLLYKTDISLDDYRRFIDDVALHLSRNGE